ncbi:MltA domain-containing protein [Legionella tunisiensis]|uniref:MltA domain-containing protein n=1 Tax=Legionella tunisiensis TaxID=1034944 RepID=UPI0002D27899|nr:MltA domain-containing protein [Legionella tunisiensis]
MKIKVLFYSLLVSTQAVAAPRFVPAEPLPAKYYEINGPALCATAKETLAYLNKGNHYDPQVIHEGKVFKLPLARVKATLTFICQHQNELQDPAFVKKHFDFIRWYPDSKQAKTLRAKPLIAGLPKDKILMTTYYVHRANVSSTPSSTYPFALYALPKDEETLTLEAANANPELIRFHYGKQAILKGALANKNVPVLAYLNRDDLEAALMQGTVVADFGDHKQTKIFNVNRNNNVPYDKAQNPYEQERYWYFKPVHGIKGYGKDAEYKITVNSGVTFAADLEQFGLGKLLMVQYPDQTGQMRTRAGILADTGGAFQNNLYQVDFLTGSYAGKEAFYQANRHLPNYVTAYFMVLKA